MFGLEKRKETDEEAFELEKDLANPDKAKKIKATVEQRIQKLKDLLRSGGGSEEFDQYGVLLHGYAALQKIIAQEPKS